jgi:hypothetical protein
VIAGPDAPEEGILERTRVPYPPSPSMLVEDVAPPPEEGTSVPFLIELQERDLWCWIALAASVRGFYQASSPVTQCTLASHLLGRSCCDAGACDVGGRPETALRAVDHYGSSVARAAASAELRSELAAGRVAGAFIAWRGGGVGHVLAISGVRPSPDGAWLQVDDPWDASRLHVLASLFAAGFKHLGTWQTTYWTIT